MAGDCKKGTRVSGNQCMQVAKHETGVISLAVTVSERQRSTASQGRNEGGKKSAGRKSHKGSLWIEQQQVLSLKGYCVLLKMAFINMKRKY